ncbi:MAG: acyl-CoA dehydratase activase [Chloroflexales bacterium]|nr:acyl-CoA dehydratase activase [Chloroflexales bacterium]
MQAIHLGIDIGSTTVKVVVVDQERNLITFRYLRSNGQPRQTLMQAVNELSYEVDLRRVAGVGITGSGGGPIAQLLGCRHINELVAQTQAVGVLYPFARTVIEIGGQDSKFLSLAWDEAAGKMALADFAMNSLCAAGTGSFLDQQAERLDIAIEDEFAVLALQARNPARIAGRCTVFAKSDMIHLQQKGTPLADILSGLCLALARNFKSVVAKGKAFIPPILFQGGVAYNQAVVRAFETLLGLEAGQIIVPQNHHIMAALGTAFVAMDDIAAGATMPFAGFGPLEVDLRVNNRNGKRMPPLQTLNLQAAPANNHAEHNSGALGNAQRIPVYIGIDVGSISTNVVLVDEQARVVARRYLHTAGKPLDAVRRGVQEIGAEMGAYVTVRGVGTTGSGRYLTADFVGADVVRNEITAQARAALAYDPGVDTIFEIGGQDSKYISLRNGAVVDFAMNSACAAGTGSFLEEQADRLRISISADFSRLALASESPVCLGERCTVFMESDIVHHQQQGAQRDELTAGLAYAIAQNYLNRVVNGRSIGKNIFFQGGVAWNQGVVAAFQQLTGRRITVPPHHDVTGAIGAALLAMETLNAQGDTVATRFRGFDLANRRYQATTFECKACPNLCEVNKVVIDTEPPIFYGALCDKFEEAGRARNHPMQILPDLFAERNRLLLGDYTAPTGPRNGRRRVAMPRVLTMYDLFPYWRAFFESLDIELVLSSATNPHIISQAREHAGTEACFPAKLVYGHILDLLDTEADFIFMPSMLNHAQIAPGQTESNYCPYIPAMPYLVNAQMELQERPWKPLLTPIHLKQSPDKQRDLYDLARQLGVSREEILAADAAGAAAQQVFYTTVRQHGRDVLAGLPAGQLAAVIVGRPYNTYDVAVCQDLPYKLRKLGVLPLPLDILPLDTVNLAERYNRIFWRSGQDILAAAQIVHDDPRLQAIYVTNFNCGPDSFLLSFFQRIMGDKPFLELELDDHTADAGIITRCEAFFDSLAMGKGSLAPAI